MSAWSSGPFDNDDAVDLMIELEEAPSWDTVREAFADVLVNPDYVELADGARAYAAAALLTVAVGKSDVSAQDYHMTLDAMGAPPADLAVLAKAALKRISTGDSEIRELYLDSGTYALWTQTVAAIDSAL
jgi:hypothetical protein